MRHLARLLRHRIVLPSATISFPSSSAVAAFSTSKRTSSYSSRAKPRPPPTESPAEDSAGDDGGPSAPAAEEAGAAWQREKLPSELPRPRTIPFQPRVANAIHLVGTVGAPVQLQRLPDGRFSAVSVLVQDRRTDFPKFWIPVIFQDDLAQIAASHLQENDLVSVSGQLTGDVPPFKHTDGQANIQVLAHLLSFVDSKATATDVMVDEEEGFMEIAQAEKKVKQTKVISKYPTRQTFSSAGYKAKQDKYKELWDDVLAHPFDWIDNRAEKANGSKNPKYPDFTKKISKEALWLTTAPNSMLEKLNGLTFSSGYTAAKTYKPFDSSMGRGTNTGWSKFKPSQAASPEKQKKEADLWKNLVDNPQDWWDNRIDKRSPKAPDFKHKENGEAIWLNTRTPSWVTEALPPAKASVGSKGARRPETLLS